MIFRINYSFVLLGPGVVTVSLEIGYYCLLSKAFPTRLSFVDVVGISSVFAAPDLKIMLSPLM